MEEEGGFKTVTLLLRPPSSSSSSFACFSSSTTCPPPHSFYFSFSLSLILFSSSPPRPFCLPPSALFLLLLLISLLLTFPSVQPDFIKGEFPRHYLIGIHFYSFTNMHPPNNSDQIIQDQHYMLMELKLLQKPPGPPEPALPLVTSKRAPVLWFSASWLHHSLFAGTPSRTRRTCSWW